MAIELKKAEFKEFLSQLPRDRSCGRKGAACGCPLTTFLVYKGARNPSVGRTTYSEDTDDGIPGTQLPGWAHDFVWAVDRNGVNTTVGAALSFLEEV